VRRFDTVQNPRLPAGFVEAHRTQLDACIRTLVYDVPNEVGGVARGFVPKLDRQRIWAGRMLKHLSDSDRDFFQLSHLKTELLTQFQKFFRHRTEP
jgi:hypothetical protein